MPRAGYRSEECDEKAPSRTKPRIAIGLEEIAGYGFNLAEGMKENGMECDMLCIYPHKFSYDNGVQTNGLVRLMSGMFSGANGKKKMIAHVGHFFLRFPLWIHSLVKYDQFIFLFNNTFFWKLDLPFMRLLRKKVVVVCMGSDVRPVYMNGLFVRDDHSIPLSKIRCKSKKQILSVRLSEIFANDIISCEAISQFEKRPYIDWYWVGIPLEIDQDAGKERFVVSKGDTIRILHSPSNRTVKGSDLISDIISRLKEKGYPIEFTEITNKPHDEVIRELERTHLVIDQLYSDTPMATFSAEASMHAVPVVVGGYLAEDIIKNDISKVPTIFCTPDRVEEVVESLLNAPEKLSSFGKMAEGYVKDRCDRKNVAGRYIVILSENKDDVRYRDPYEDRYIKGSGAPLTTMTDTYSRIYHKWGEKGFMLNDRKNLLASVLSLLKDTEKKQ
jgi:hypothetical protein